MKQKHFGNAGILLLLLTVGSTLTTRRSLGAEIFRVARIWGKCLRFSRRKLWLSSLICISLLFSGCKKQGSKTPEPVILKDGAWITIPFTLKGTPKITRSLPPDIPIIGAMGKNTYRFTGLIKYQGTGRRVSLTSEPQGLFYHSGVYYFVTQDFFVQGHFNLFVFREETDRLTIATYAKCPEGLSELALNDPFSDRMFKIWCLRKIADSQGVAESISQFVCYVKREPRCLLRCYYTGYNGDTERKIGEDFVGQQSIVELYLASLHQKHGQELKPDLYDALHLVLINTKPNDIATGTRNICLSLFKLRPEKAVGDIQKYFDKAEKENFQDDKRLYWREVVLKYIGETGKEKD